MTDLKSKKITGLRAALAFKAENDELKNAQAKRDLDFLEKGHKKIKALQPEVERLKKSQRKKDNAVRDDEEVLALRFEIKDLTKSQQKKIFSLAMILP